MMENLEIKEKIILTAIELIEKLGLQNVTTRAVAGAAGVNIAAINYYFGSKQSLLEIAMKKTLDHAVEDWREIITQNENPSEMIKQFMMFLLEGMIKFPNISKAHLYDPLMKGDYEALITNHLNSLLESILDKIASGRTESERKSLRISLVQITSAIMLAGLMPGLLSEFSGLGYENREAMEEYIDHLLKVYGNYEKSMG